MCVVSNLGDDYGRSFPQRWPDWVPTVPSTGTGGTTVIRIPPDVSRAEFDALKNEVSELVKLLKAAKIYDEATGQADCEKDEKVALIKQLAETLEVDLEDLFDE
jgi:hypothetical protein